MPRLKTLLGVRLLQHIAKFINNPMQYDRNVYKTE
jgi:hypothetical protein